MFKFTLVLQAPVNVAGTQPGEPTKLETPVIFNKKLNKSKIKSLEYINSDTGKVRHFPPAAQEWYNSIYTYNHNYANTLPTLDKNLMTLLRSYFSMFINNKVLKIKRIPMRERRSTLKKIFLGKGDIKHTNSNVTITFYVFNLEKRELKINFKLAYQSYYAPLKEIDESNEIVPLKKFVGVDEEGNLNKDPEGKIIITYNRPYTLKEFFTPYHKFKLYFHDMSDVNLIPKLKITTYNEVYYSTVAKLMGKLTNYLETMVGYYRYLNELVNTNIISEDEKLLLYTDLAGQFNSFKYPKADRYRELAKMSYTKKLIRYLYLLKFNSVKFDNIFILKLKRMVENLYGKKVEFNIVNLKKVHLNSDIFTQTIALKLKNRENRLFRVLRSSLSRIKLPNVKKITYLESKSNREEYLVNKIRNTYVKLMLSEDLKVDSLNNLLQKYIPSTDNLNIKVRSKKSIMARPISLKSYIFRFLKHFKLRGIRVEAKGRLTRRFTASRSVFKVRWKGGLKNIDSSFRGLSAVMLRGDAKSNVQYSRINSKNRIGAFGVKG